MSESERPAPSFEIPDLELQPAVSKRAPSSASGSSASPSARGPSRGRELDIEAVGGVPLGAGPSSAGAAFGLEIDLSSDAFDEDDLEPIQTGSNVEYAGGVTQAALRQKAVGATWPSGRTRSAEQLPVDPAEVALLADYGAAPKSALLSPLYAYRVYARRGPLKKALAEQHAVLLSVEAARDAALVQLTSELRPTLEASDAFRRLLEPLREAERLSGDRSAALAQADAGYREQMGRFDAQLAAVAEALTGASAVTAERQAQHETQESELLRAEAKLKRVQIEMRGVLDLARQALGPEGGDMPAAQAAQLAELKSRQSALEPELAGVRGSYAQSAAAYEQARKAQRQLESQRKQLERQRHEAGAALAQQVSQRAASVTQAEKQLDDGLAEVARAVLAARGALAVPQATLDALREHDRAVEARALAVETHVRALDAFERERVRQGVILALSALGLVVLAIALKAVL